jgi:FkbM family methyltransferase
MFGTTTDALISKYGWRRGLHLLWHYRQATLLPRGRLVRVQHPDLPFPVYLRARSSDAIVLKQSLIQGTLDYPLPQAPDFIIDAGANIGVVSAVFATRYPRARIVAIELEQSNVELLRRNVAPYPNVTVLHAALWGHSTQLILENPGAEAWAFRATEASVTDTSDTASTAAVPALTVDDVLRQFAAPRVDLLKVDIEGGEREVFRDTQSPWLATVAVVAIEIHEQAAPGSEAAVAQALPPSRFARAQHGDCDVFTRR